MTFWLCHQEVWQRLNEAYTVKVPEDATELVKLLEMTEKELFDTRIQLTSKVSRHTCTKSTLELIPLVVV